MSETTEETKKESTLAEDGYVSDDPIILEAFNDVKAAILAKRTDIVRQILSAAQSLREEDEYDSDGEEKDKKEVGDKYDRGEYLDLLSLLLLHKDTDSGTLLHYATRIDSPDIVRTILSAGGNCTVKNIENLNAFNYCQSDQMRNVFIGELMQAVSQSRIYRVQQLILAGIDINSCDGASSNNSVLHWAASFSDLPTVQFVIEKGGDVNALNAIGETPLHDAVKRGDKDIIIELLKNGASINILSIKGVNEGKSPYMLTSNKPELRKILEEYSTGFKEQNESVDTTTGLTNGDATLAERSVTSPKKSLRLITPVEVDKSMRYLCPPPQIIRQFDGLYLVPPTELTVALKVDEDLIQQTKEVIDLFLLKLQDIGVKMSFQLYNDEPVSRTYMQCIVNKNGLRHRDEYKLQLSTNKICLLSSGLSSLYYGMATFLQVLKIYRGKAIPLVQISDWPTHKNRGVLFDFNENDAPNIKQMWELADLLSLFKINQIQINVEHIDTHSPRFFFDSKEFLEFQLFCNRRFIRVVPYIKITTNSSLVRHHNDRDEIVIGKFEHLVSCFICPKTLHVSIRDAENIYQDVLRFCSKKKLHLQLTAEKPLDIHLDQLVDLIDSFSFSLQCENVESLKEQIDHPTNLGLPYDVFVDDVTLRNRLFPNYIESISNVHEIASHLPKQGCCSFIVLFGKKSSHLNNLSLLLPGLLTLSSMSWNIPDTVDEKHVREITNSVIYEDDSEIIGSRVIGLGLSIPGCNATMIDDIIQMCSTETKALLSNEEVQGFCRNVKALKADLEKMKLKISMKQFVYDELAMLTEILFFIARLCYGLLNNQALPLEIKNLSQVNKSDNSNRLMSLLKQYEGFVNTYYKHRINASHVSLKLLQNILKDILPANVTSSAPNILGVFTV